MTTQRAAPVVSPAQPGQRAHRPRPAGRSSTGLRSRGCLAAFYLGCLLAAGSYGLTLLLPSLLKAAGGSPAQAGLIYWCGAFGAGGTLLFTGRLILRTGARWGGAAGPVLYTLATAILASSGARSPVAYLAGVLLGAGWALFLTCAPIIASSLPGRTGTGGRFMVLAGFNALGIGAGPIAGQLLTAHGASFPVIFRLAALGSLGAAGLLCLVARLTHPPTRTSRAAPGGRAGHPGHGIIGPARLVLASRTRSSLLMVALGACVFTTMTSYQSTLEAASGMNPEIFFVAYTLGVLIPRFTLTGVLARFSPPAATTTLLAGMCLSLTGFMLIGHDVAGYVASSALLGVTYGLAYPLIQGQAADGAPAGHRDWALWYFSLAYFAGLYGFPLIAGTVIDLGGYRPLIACLLVIGASNSSCRSGQRFSRAELRRPECAAGR